MRQKEGYKGKAVLDKNQFVKHWMDKYVGS